jgi:hypothetical protein
MVKKRNYYTCPACGKRGAIHCPYRPNYTECPEWPHRTKLSFVLFDLFKAHEKKPKKKVSYHGTTLYFDHVDADCPAVDTSKRHKP